MEIDDAYIRRKYFGKNDKYIPQKINYANEEEIEYIMNRYKDSKSLKESLYRIYWNIEIRPVCKICGKEVNFISGKCKSKGKLFDNCCSIECQNKYRNKNKINAFIKKYGVNNPWANKSVIAKIRETVTRNHGGYTLATEEGRKKVTETSLKLYGVENPGGSKQALEKQKKTCLERYGVENPWQIPEVKESIIETQKKNGTFRKSRQEDEIYHKLIKIYKNVYRQYKSELYPYKCDFYIEDIDTYIEYQGFFTHGPHPYNPNNIYDINLLNQWKKLDSSERCYHNAIITWTIKDPEKRNIARKNNLNYIEFFNMKEFYKWYYTKKELLQ